MSASGNAGPGSGALELPTFSLDVQALDLGADVKAVGLELLETESREPVKGKEAAEIWAALFPALSGGDFFVLDFFSHLNRVRQFREARKMAFREAAERCLVLPQPSQEHLQQLFERFEAETFGARAGAAARVVDAALESELSQRGLDAYQAAYTRYTFCAVCEPEDGWVTLLSETLGASEVIRRARPAVHQFDVYIARAD
ncbi:MAG: hypothetical protein ACHQLQ_11240 [Candidatus Acidiferrales bacterium]